MPKGIIYQINSRLHGRLTVNLQHAGQVCCGLRIMPMREAAADFLNPAAAFWRIDNKTLPKDAAFDQLKFELVISGQHLARTRRQQLDLSLNIQRRKSGTVNMRIAFFGDR
jgi:hypothetical protein